MFSISTYFALKRCKKLHGKGIVYERDYEGCVSAYEAFVLCDPKIGITVKPLDPERIPPRGFGVKPSDPAFFFYCYMSNREDAPKEFDLRVKNLLKEGPHSFLSIVGRDPGMAMYAVCPFSA